MNDSLNFAQIKPRESVQRLYEASNNKCDLDGFVCCCGIQKVGAFCQRGINSRIIATCVQLSLILIDGESIPCRSQLIKNLLEIDYN